MNIRKYIKKKLLIASLQDKCEKLHLDLWESEYDRVVRWEKYHEARCIMKAINKLRSL